MFIDEGDGPDGLDGPDELDELVGRGIFVGGNPCAGGTFSGAGVTDDGAAPDGFGSLTALCARSCKCGGTNGPNSASKAEISSALGEPSPLAALPVAAVFLAAFFAGAFFAVAGASLSGVGVALG